MKTCPVCKARAFDDAQVCYGCLHKFSQQEMASHQEFPAASQTVQVGNLAGSATVRPAVSVHAPEAQSQEREGDHVENRTIIRQNVAVPGRDADIVVRIELVEPLRERGAFKRADAETSPECNLLRRGRPARVTDNARPAEAGRVVSAGQMGAREQGSRPRHAADAPAGPYAEAEIA